MRLSRIRSVLGLLLKAAEVAALIIVCVLFVQIRETAKDADKTLVEARATIVEVRQRAVDTSQNANAVLLQLGLAADEARQASGEQRRYLNQMGKQGVALLGDARHSIQTLDQTIAKLGTDTDRLSDSAVSAIDNIPPLLDQGTRTLSTAEGLVGDPDIPKAIKSLADASQNTADATKSLAGAAGDVQKKVHELTKPVSFVKSLLSSMLGWAANVATIIK